MLLSFVGLAYVEVWHLDLPVGGESAHGTSLAHKQDKTSAYEIGVTIGTMIIATFHLWNCQIC
jgi:hypothetical protein